MPDASSAQAASLALGAAGALLRLTPIRSPYPGAPAPGAGDALAVAVTVHGSPFFGALVTEAGEDELRRLRGLLAELHAAGQAGAAPQRHAFALRAGTVRLDLALAPGGALTVGAEVSADPSGPTALRTALRADLPDLPRWMAELDALLAAYRPAPRPG